MRTLGIILVIIGIVMTVFTGFTMVTKEKIVDLGPLEVNKEEKTPIYWNPILGMLILVGGVLVIVTAKKG